MNGLRSLVLLLFAWTCCAASLAALDRLVGYGLGEDRLFRYDPTVDPFWLGTYWAFAGYGLLLLAASYGGFRFLLSLTQGEVKQPFSLISRHLPERRRRVRSPERSLLARQAAATETEASPEEDAFVAAVRSYILAHLDDGALNVERLAGALYLSRAQLYRKLKRQAGISPTQLLRQVRLREAKVFLRATGLSIAEIAYRCGYNDPGFFSRVFKDTTGMTPTDFREEE